MSAPTIGSQIKKYEFQCDLIYALLALTQRFWCPEKVKSFFQKWSLESAFWGSLDKHLYHGIYMLFYFIDRYAPHENCVPAGSSARISELRRQLDVHHFFLGNETVGIASLLEKNNIPCLVLKGMAYFFLFPDSYFQTRLSSDIDLLIQEKDLERAHAFLFSCGYKTVTGVDPYFPSEEILKKNYYEKTYAKQAGELRAEVGLHWSIPTGRLMHQDHLPCFEKVSDELLARFWNRRRSIHWQNQSVSVLSHEDMSEHFFLNVARDFTGQMNVVRWVQAAVDLHMFEQSGVSVPIQSKRAAALKQFADRLFQKKPPAQSVPSFFYQSMAIWAVKKRHAYEVWGALWLSRAWPWLFRALGYFHIVLQNTLGKKRCVTF